MTQRQILPRCSDSVLATHTASLCRGWLFVYYKIHKFLCLFWEIIRGLLDNLAERTNHLLDLRLCEQT